MIDPEKEVDGGEENVNSGYSGKRGHSEHSEKRKKEKTECQHAREEKKGEIVIHKVLELVKNSVVLELAQQPKCFPQVSQFPAEVFHWVFFHRL